MQLNMAGNSYSNGGPEQGGISDNGQNLVALWNTKKLEIEAMVIRTVQQLIGNGGSEQGSSSDDGQNLVALWKIKPQIELLVIQTIHQVIRPTFEDMIRKAVQEEIQSTMEKHLTGGIPNSSNEMTMSKERSLELRFLDEVSVPVLTGKLLKGKEDNFVRVALVDRTTGQVVNCGPESSAKVEILVLDASGDDNEQNWTLQDFNNRIIREGDKEKPHFAKSVQINLKEGIGILCNAKLGHGANWTKSCKCRLAARIAGNFRGIEVQEGWTESFMVSDSRGSLYKKHVLLSLSDKVWRLKNISRNGAPCKRLKENNISTVQHFLFLLSADPQRLEKIVGGRTAKWEATANHARTCIIDDKKMYLHYLSTGSKMGVIFDAVGGLKGVIEESYYVPINNLSADEKDCAHKFLVSAFENWNERTSFDDEASLLQKYPYRLRDINSSTNSSILEGSSGCDLTTSENTIEYHPSEPVMREIYEPVLDVSTPFRSCQFPDPENIYAFAPTDPGTSSQSITPSSNNMFCFGSYGSPTTGQLFESHLGIQTPSWLFSYHDSFLEPFGENGGLMPPFNPEIDNLSETFRAESHSHQQINDSARHRVGPVVKVVSLVNAMLWVVRVKKRVMALGGIHVQKRQRI